MQSFWAQVKKGPGCWLWTGWKQNAGYGETSLRSRKITVHRVSYMLAYGPIPKGKLVMHTCDQPLCVRPDHLRLGTDADNRADAVAKNRHAHGEMFKRTAKLTNAIVKTIRAEYRLWREGSFKRSNAKKLAARYGVCAGAITAVIAGRSWRHVA